MSRYTKKFNGKIYKLHGNMTTKGVAQEHATKLKKKGYNVRITTSKPKWSAIRNNFVWKRKK